MENKTKYVIDTNVLIIACAKNYEDNGTLHPFDQDTLKNMDPAVARGAIFQAMSDGDVIIDKMVAREFINVRERLIKKHEEQINKEPKNPYISYESLEIMKSIRDWMFNQQLDVTSEKLIIDAEFLDTKMLIDTSLLAKELNDAFCKKIKKVNVTSRQVMEFKEELSDPLIEIFRKDLNSGNQIKKNVNIYESLNKNTLTEKELIKMNECKHVYASIPRLPTPEDVIRVNKTKKDGYSINRKRNPFTNGKLWVDGYLITKYKNTNKNKVVIISNDKDMYNLISVGKIEKLSNARELPAILRINQSTYCKPVTLQEFKDQIKLNQDNTKLI